MTAAPAPAAAPADDENAAPDITIRAKTPSPKRLSRKVLLAGAISMGSVIALALMSGLSERPDRIGAGEPEANAAAQAPPDTIRLASPQYDASNLAREDAAGEGDMLWDNPPANGELQPPGDAMWSGASAAPASPGRPAEAVDPEAAARIAPILFAGSGRDGGGPGASPVPAGRHASFLAAPSGGDERLGARLTPPRSAYEIIAGSIIPAALQTELNSDLPGRVIAQTTAPVFDTVTGRHLLIPQGARLIGAYDSATTYGDRRLLLLWTRLILPNGWSINLQGMEGADPTGAAGLRDRTDNHLDRLAAAIGLSAIISVIANDAEDHDENGDSLSRSVGDAAAQQAAQTGGRIVDRELSVRPTLRVRAGAPVRVLVTRDIRLRPYRPHTSEH